jgi:glucose-6-phosphate 1-dehydrogenase
MDDNLAKSTLLAVIGISGDLSHRYLLPALAQVGQVNKLPEDFTLLGISRRDISAAEVLSTPELANSKIAQNLQIHKMDLENPEDYRALAEKINTMGKQQILFYFAVPPDAVQQIITNLGQAGLNGPNVKLLLEKPFGKDLESAKAVIKDVDQYFKEEQVYRIDHYLAKEMAQNITVFLGGNALFRSVWDNNFIEYIEVIVAQDKGIEGRAKFYEQTGALRDIIQSHALQLAALMIMEPCSNVFEFTELPQHRLEALGSLKLAHNQDGQYDAVRGQYEGYRQEVSNPESQTETFVSLSLYSDMPKWQGVPIRVSTGKSLNERESQIRVRFKKNELSEANLLVLRIQPHEGIELDLWVKEPGYERKLKKLNLSFNYDQHFKRIPNAYEQVLVEALRSSKHLFASSGEVLATWQILQPILDHWKTSSQDLLFYKPGSSVEQVLGQATPK